MSKKKSGSTMTLKDFHGGSIPSVLPLPSAPGVSARPPDRPGSWNPPGLGSGSGSDPFHHHHRNSRPGSAGGLPRGSDPQSLPGSIGRHFDEDERKPFDSSVPPRRPLSDPVPRSAQAVPRSDPVPRPQVHPRPASGPGQNAWGVRREVAVDSPSVLTGPGAAEKLAQASALEKISSGRWNTRTVVPLPVAAADVDVIRIEGLDQRFEESVRVTKETRERGHVDGIWNLDQERGKYGGGPHLQQTPEFPRQPGLRLVDASEARASEEKQVYQLSVHPLHMENAHDMYGSISTQRPGSAEADSGNRVIDRPRLNIKPRSLPVEQSDETTEKERKAVFGGARPRELVLKERGIDTMVATTPDITLPANRAKNDISKTEMNSELVAPTTQRSERFETFPYDQRKGKDLERKEYRADFERVERTSWRNNNRKNIRENEKPVERREEPDTWRKPVVEQPKPEVAVPGPRNGRAASALELAQAFSRSKSDTKPDNPGPSQRSPTKRAQVPFSRLTDTRELYGGPTQRKINGY